MPKTSPPWRGLRAFYAFGLAVGVPLTLAFTACSGGNDDPSDASVGPDRARLDAPIQVDAACPIFIETPPFLDSPHVPIGTPVQYDSNPPSSGPHYPIWAAFKAYTTPVDRRYYVHDLEHGAVVVAYRCDDGGGCPELAAQLQSAIDALPDDPLCDQGAGVRVRAVLTPDPLLDVPIAAAAWGWIYRAQCLDLPSLRQFLRDHYAQGNENFCTNGVAEF